MQKKKEEKKLKFDIFSGLNTLTKFRLIVTLIFLLSTLAIILILVGDFVVSPVLFFISYILVLVLMVKLFLVKKL